jgi:hypothetical protein
MSAPKPKPQPELPIWERTDLQVTVTFAELKARYTHCNAVTIWRWINNEGFPKPMAPKGR